MTPDEKPTQADLNAYLDGEFAAEEGRRVEAGLQAHPDAARTLSEYARVDEALRARFAPVVDEPLPERLDATLARETPLRAVPAWLRVAATIVMLLASGLAGYGLRGHLDSQALERADLVDLALSAHAVYTPEVRHPVEVGANEEAHLVKWLTKRIGAPVRAPDLSARGFRLLGGRLLPDAQASAAQFMYENPDGKRVTLYVRQAGPGENTAFQFADADGMSAFYWIDRPLAYALVAELPREDLLVVARITYEQLN